MTAYSRSNVLYWVQEGALWSPSLLLLFQDLVLEVDDDAHESGGFVYWHVRQSAEQSPENWHGACTYKPDEVGAHLTVRAVRQSASSIVTYVPVVKVKAERRVTSVSVRLTQQAPSKFEQAFEPSGGTTRYAMGDASVTDGSLTWVPSEAARDRECTAVFDKMRYSGPAGDRYVVEVDLAIEMEDGATITGQPVQVIIVRPGVSPHLEQGMCPSV